MALVPKLQARVKDRISALPDPLLCHILSFLPTRYAVQTTFLSRRRKNLWTSVPNLDFDDEHHGYEFASFSRYVDNVLFFRDSLDIHKFRLSCYGAEDLSRIDGWIRTAIRRNVVELDLCVESEEQIFELPQTLFLCKTLRVLRLTSNFITNTPTSGCFPSLRSFRVDIAPPHNNSMENLFLDCPVLEYLFIYGYHGDDAVWIFPLRNPQGDVVSNFRVSAPELKTLKIHWNSHGDSEKCSFFIAAPKLENFDLTQNVLTDCFLENTNSLAKATITVFDHSGNENHRFAIRAIALLAGISNVEYLSLSSHDLKALICGDSSAPQWNPPELLPICLLSHLQTLSIKGFKGKLDEMEAAKYLLKNAKVLYLGSFVSERGVRQGIYKVSNGFKDLSS